MLKLENRINHEIRVPNIRLIDSNGDKVGIVPTYKAQQMAESQCLDLVEISSNSNPPVCKIMDFGKYKYQQEKKSKENKQVVIKTKEIIFHPNISDHDYSYRVEQAKQFLHKGNKVKASVVYRGREINYEQLGREVLNRFLHDLNGLCVLESNSFEGKILSIILRKS